MRPLGIYNLKMEKKKIFLLGILLFVFVGINAAECSLFYDKPASNWNEALPIGNGRLGAMIYGNPIVDELQLNEETIWAGRPNNNANPDALENISKVRDLIFKGKYYEAQELATQKIMSQTNSGMPYQTFGSLRISFPDHSGYKNYRRELSLDSAIVKVSYTVDGVRYNREIFSSFADQVIEIHLTASKKGKIDFNAILTTLHKDVVTGVDNSEKAIFLSGVSSKHEHCKGKVRFNGRVSVVTDAGSVCVQNGVLSVKDANSAVIYVSIATNFNNYKDISGDEVKRAKDYLDKAKKVDYNLAKEEHVKIFRSYMDRVKFTLDYPSKYDNLPTDRRILEFSKHPDDGGLVTTYFNFGRYLLISSSQPGGQPANLQGIWNDRLFPPWDSKYTCNINLEMNYWPAQVTNLNEMEEPLFSLIKDVSETGAETAKTMYGARGWVLHHNTDIWRVTGGIDKAASGMWPSGEAWLCRSLWERYLYSGDKDFLKKVYPLIKGAAEFYDDIAVHEPDHNWLVISPSLSPENVHAGEPGMKKAAVACGCTMDNQLMFDLWHYVISASEILDTDKNFAKHLKKRLEEIPPMQIGSWGQLQEWMYDWDDSTDTHRHVSHLYGLFPSNQISPYRTPKLFNAAKTSLLHRGDESTGWSMGWKVCLWARFLDGNHAFRLIQDQLTLFESDKKRGGTYPNMFDAHPPFQIDGNFGCTAGIAEMLMQSYDGFIYLLPALPDVWKNGEIKGIRSRGGFEFDIKWKDNKVAKVVIKSTIGGRCRLRSVNKLSAKGLKIAKGKNSNSLFELNEIKKPLVHDDNFNGQVKLRKTYLYDLDTKPGKEYVLYGK